MKKVVFLLLVTLSAFQTLLHAQIEKDVKSKITQVTVFSTGAQIESEATFDMQQGKTILLFKNLSPYISKESIRLYGDGKYTILNVQLKNDFLNQLEKNKEITDLTNSIEQYADKIEDEETLIKVLNEKLDFLRANKSIAGKEQAINPESYKSLNSIYGDNFEKYSLEILKKERLKKEYTKELGKLKDQLNTLSSKNDTPSGVITVMINSKQVQTAKIKMKYLVGNANWYPTFDIRFIDTNKPLTISYKANIKQNIGIDWVNVGLKLSTAKTNVSAQIPSLNPSYLNFHEPIARLLEGRASGAMIANNSGGPGSNVRISIRGASSTGSNSNPLYVVDGIPQSDISSISPENIENAEVLKSASAISMYGSRAENGVVIVTTKKKKGFSAVPMTTLSKNETSNEYTIDGQQTINSDNKENMLTYKEIELNASYEYQSIPRLSKNVYLIGKVNDWYKADLMDGDANIYMENSFVGESKINTQQFTDTLDISFGIDNSISVDREKIKDFSESKFIGSYKKETIAWKLSIRNNKTYPIKAKLFDQVPVSSNKEIQVETLELTGGTMNSNTGKVQWALDLKPNETKQLILKYSIKYPSEKTVVID